MRKLLWFLLLAWACQSEGPKPYWTSCGNLDWMTSMKNETQVIKSYRYKGQVVFLVEDTCTQCADLMAEVYDCTGKAICQFGGIAGLNTCPDFSTTATDELLVWKN